jgi:immune inhibitor A
VDATFDLSAYQGTTIGLRIRYVTDGGVQGDGVEGPAGIFVDNLNVTVDDATVFSDGAEDGENGWTADGFSIVGSSLGSVDYDQFYIAAWRTYTSYDKYLKTGPYNFGDPSRPDWVDHFSYEQGLLISYWDTYYTDNNTSEHPGSGRNLYIDAHPKTIYNIEGKPWRGRIQSYDAPFGLTKAKSFTLHINGKASYIRGQDAQPVFNDTKNWFDPNQPTRGVYTANAGVKIKVLNAYGKVAKIQLSPVS